MAGLTPQTPLPSSITVHQISRVLEVGFSNGSLFRIPFELMRVSDRQSAEPSLFADLAAPSAEQVAQV